MSARACCCGHMRWEHRADGLGSCRVCGGISCAHFHEIGAGHPSPLFILAIVLLTAALVLAVWCVGHPGQPLPFIR